MSYILDALKKSEAERSNRDHREFAHRVPFESAPRKKREIWPYLLVVALLANALVVVYVMFPEAGPGEAAVVSGEPAVVERQDPVEPETRDNTPEPIAPEETEASETSRTTEESETAEAPETTEPSASSAPAIAADRPSQTAGETSPNGSPDAAVQQGKTASPEPPTETSEEVSDIREMPRSVQRRVPEMTFNAHLHSSNPSSRSVMINNRMLREGDRVGELKIQEITPAGVVFRLDEHVFQIGIVRDWQGAL